MADLTGNALRVTADGAAGLAGRDDGHGGLAGLRRTRARRGGARRTRPTTGADLLVADLLAVQAARDVAPAPHRRSVTPTAAPPPAPRCATARPAPTTSCWSAARGRTSSAPTQLHLPAGHVFVGASSRDPVSYLDRFGADPAHASFGATRFQAEDPTRNSWRLDFDDHSKYFDAGTESLANIVDVVTGDYADVERAAYRGEVFLLPDGINSDPEADREPTTAR